LNLMKVSLGKKKFQVMIFPGSQYSIDLKAGRKPGKLYLFLWTSRAGLGVRTINKLEKAGFGTTSYPQKHFLIREMGSKTKQINEIVSYIDQSMRLLK